MSQTCFGTRTLNWIAAAVVMGVLLVASEANAQLIRLADIVGGGNGKGTGIPGGGINPLDASTVQPPMFAIEQPNNTNN
jgi:hypothetical protein